MKSSPDKENISMFGSADAAKPLPSKNFPQHSMHAEESFQLIRDELMLDGNARQNLATFCQTWDDPQVHRLMDLCISKNMIDKDEYPQCAEI